MASIEAGGVGSGLDIAGLVKQLVAAERAPESLRINRAESGTKAKLSALASVTGALDALKTALDPLRKADSFNARKVSNTHSEFFTASAGSKTPLGTFDVKVLDLASAHKLQSAALTKDADLGFGQLLVTVDDKSFTVNLPADASTPAEIVSAFNTAAETAGAKVRASLATSDTGQHLVFTATATGAANAITVSKLAGDPGLDALTTPNLTERAPARDASILIDQLVRTSSTNTFTDVVEGLTFTAKKKTDPAETYTFSVAQDHASRTAAMDKVVTAYNAAIRAIANATKYDPKAKVAAALNGDAGLRGAASQLRDAMSSVFGTGVDLGFKTAVDGTLTLDKAKFDKAIAEEGDKVTAFLHAGGGLADRMFAIVDSYVGTDGAFVSRTKSFESRIEQLGKDRERLDVRMKGVEARYRKQFTALDSMLASMKNTSDYLARQLASLS